MLVREIGERRRRGGGARAGSARSVARVGRRRRGRAGRSPARARARLRRGGERGEPLPRRRGPGRGPRRCSPASRRGARSSLVFEDLHHADPLLLDLIEQLLREARRLPLLVVVRGALGAAGRPAELGRRARRRGDALGGAPAARARGAAGRGGRRPRRGRRRARRRPRRRQPVLHHRDRRACSPREERGVPPEGPAPSGTLLPPTVQAVIAARIDQLSAPAPRARAPRLGLPARPVRRGRARAARGTGRGAAGGGRGRGAARPRGGPARRVAVPQRRRSATWRTRRSPSASASACTCAWRTACPSRRRPIATRGRSRSTWSRRPGRRSTSTRATAHIAERAVEALAAAGDQARRRIESRAAVDLYERALALAGPEEGWGAREAWIVSMLGEARYWLGEFDAAEDLFHRALDAGRRRRRDGRARGAVPRRHHAHDPRRRPPRERAVRAVARGRAPPRATRACSRARC